MIVGRNGFLYICRSQNKEVNLFGINLGSVEEARIFGSLTIGDKTLSVYFKKQPCAAIEEDLEKIYKKVFLEISSAARQAVFSGIDQQDLHPKPGNMPFDILKERIFEIVDRMLEAKR